MLDTQPKGGRTSQPTHDAVEARASTPVSSICGEPSLSSLTDTLLSDEEEVSQPPSTVINDETSGDLWNDLQNYKLPLFPPCVKTLLQTRKSPQDYLPGTSNRRRIIEVLTCDLQKRNILTPSKQGYTNLLDALFSEYPHIGDPKCWRMSLRTKMKNIRVPLTSHNTVKILKEKFGCPVTGGRKSTALSEKEEVQPRKKRQKLKVDLEGHEDDEVTTRAHIDALNAELRKGSPDLAVIAVKMDRTFVYRWKRINDQRLSVADIISEFPALRRRNFLAGEAERHGILKPLENSYLQLHTSLLELMKYTKSRCKGYKEYFSKYQEDLDSSLNEDKRIECGLQFAVQLLPSLFREDATYLLADSNENIKSPAPVLTCEGGEYQLHINGAPLLATKSSKFTNALEALFQSYWVFSLEYPKEIEKTLLFLESYIFQHNTKLPACVSTWAKKIGMKL